MSAPFDRVTAQLKVDATTSSGQAEGTGNLRQTDPPEVAELNARGDNHVRAGDVDEAIRCFERAGRAYKDAHFFGKALAVYKKLERLDEASIDTKFSLAEVSVGLKRKREACRYFESAIELDRMLLTSQRSVAILKGICDLSPGDTALRLELARTCVNGGFRYEAHEAFLAAARELARAGETRRAEAAFQGALDNNPESSSALTDLAEMLISAGRVAEAVSMMRDVVERYPHNPELLVVLGKTCRRADRFDDAQAAFERLLEIDATQARYLVELGSRLASAGEIDRALKIVDRVVARASGMRTHDAVIGLLRQIAASDTSREDALVQLAATFEQMGDRANAVAALEKILDRARGRGDEDRVVTVLARLVKVAPESAPYKAELDVLRPPPKPEKPAEVVEIELAVSDYSDDRGLEIVPEPEPPPVESAPAEVSPPPKPQPSPAVPQQGSEGSGFAEWLEVVRRRKESADANAGAKPRPAAPKRPPAPTASAANDSATHRPIHVELENVVVVRGFETYLECEWRRAARTSTPVSLLRIRAFPVGGDESELTREWSDAIGDALERALARPGDLLLPCDLGDFVALLPGTMKDGALVVARRMCATVFDLGAAGAGRIAVGIASANPTRGADKRGLVGASESALEAACESTERLSIVAQTA